VIVTRTAQHQASIPNLRMRKTGRVRAQTGGSTLL
jgi:hypothetical protein